MIVVKSKVNTNPVTKRKIRGIVYVLEMSVEGTLMYKVGVTARGGNALESRVMEISVSYYRQYGYFPQVVPLRYGSTKWYYEVESCLHQKLSSHTVKVKKFDGHTELFGCSREEVLRWYDAVMTDPLSHVTPTEAAMEAQAAAIDLTDMQGANDVEPILVSGVEDE